MGRNQSNPTRKYFSFDVSTNTCTCLIEGCGKLLKGNHAGNLGRHVARWHAEKYQKIMEESNSKRPTSPSIPPHILKRPKLLIGPSTNRDEVIDACVELVTVNGRPLSLMDDSGFQKLLHVTILSQQDGSYNMNSEVIMDEVRRKALYIREVITNELNGKLISIKIDIATMMKRTLVSINAQFISNGSVILRTLAVKELKEKCTVLHFKTVLLDVLAIYNLSMDQIYTVTTDNCTSVMFLNGQSKYEHEDDICAEVLDGLVIADESEKDGRLVGERCAAHVLQLAVEDTCKKDVVASTIQQASAVCKILNTEAVLKTLRKPVLGSISCWHSVLDMLESLVDLKDFILDVEATHKDLEISDWTKIDDIISALQPVKIAAKQLKEEQLTFGSFFGVWLQCQIDIGKMGSYFADSLMAAMKAREKMLFENEAFISSIFLDPRYHVMLSADHRVRAKRHLIQVWLKLEGAKRKSFAETEKTSYVEVKVEPEEEDEVEMLLKSREFMQQLSESENINAQKEIGPALDSFVGSPRLNRKGNILEYWSSNKLTNPKLHALSDVVHAVPATQFSAERLRSAFEFVLSPMNFHVKNNALENFLLVRCNQQFLLNRLSECGTSVSSLVVPPTNSSTHSESIYPDWGGFSWFPSTSPGENWDTTIK